MDKFSPGKLMTAFFVFFFPILIYLGSWQVSRGLEKEVIVSQHYKNKSLPVINEKQMDITSSDKLTYRTINLNGYFGSESYFLDNRLYMQEAGYEVFTNFKSSGNKTFLVNRGWISKKDFNKEGLAINESELSIQGILSPFKRFGLSLANEILEQDWPKYVQELDYDQAKSDLGNDLNNAVIQLSAGSIGALEPIWKPIELKPSRHYGYAVQWFGLALVLICSFFHFGFKKD